MKTYRYPKEENKKKRKKMSNPKSNKNLLDDSKDKNNFNSVSNNTSVVSKDPNIQSHNNIIP